jgi:anti-sigma-K factor RskA
MSDWPPLAEPDDLLAGEYVLGMLDAAAMASVRRRAATDAPFAAAIAAWERRLAPLADTVPPVVPPPDLWQRLEGAIAAPPPAAAARDPARPSPWRSVRVWQGTTAAALALAAAIAAIAILPGQQPTPMQFAALCAPGAAAAAPGYMAKAMADGTLVVAAVAPGPVPSGREMELWILPPGADRPASLGMLPAAGRRITVASMPATGTQLMISLEPVGGSPTGAPTGPVVYAGMLVAA